MIRVMNINNIESFLKMTDETKGDVMLKLPDGTEADLKHSHTVRQMLRVMPIKDAELNIQLTDNSDLPMFLHYLMGQSA